MERSNAIRILPPEDPFEWQGEKLGKLDRLVRDNPKPKAYVFPLGNGNNIVVVDERRSYGGGHKLPLVAQLIRHNLLSQTIKDGICPVLLCPGGTAVAMALVCRDLGMPFIAILPKSVSAKKREFILAAGGDLVVTEDIDEARDKEFEYRARPGYAVIDQFSEMVRALPAKNSPGERMFQTVLGSTHRLPTMALTAIGTGMTANTIRLAASGFRARLSIVGVDVAGGVLANFNALNLHGRAARSHLIEGSSPGFVPASFTRSSVDRIAEVGQEDAIAACHHFAELGLRMGPTSGMAMFGALAELRNMDSRARNQLVATFCYDDGESYGDNLYDKGFLRAQGIDLDAGRRRLEKLIAGLL